MLANGASSSNSVKWFTGELFGRLNKRNLSVLNSPVGAESLADLVKRIDDGTISGKAGKDVLDVMMNSNKKVDDIIDQLGLKQISDDGAILTMIDDIMNANTIKVEQYRAGKDKLLGFFVGQVMKASKGSANPAKVNELLKSKLNA